MCELFGVNANKEIDVNIKYAVTLTLGQIMMEKAREKAKAITPEEARERSRQALQELLSGEVRDEWPEVKEILEEADKKWKELKGAKG